MCHKNIAKAKGDYRVIKYTETSYYSDVQKILDQKKNQIQCFVDSLIGSTDAIILLLGSFLLES